MLKFASLQNNGLPKRVSLYSEKKNNFHVLKMNIFGLKENVFSVFQEKGNWRKTHFERAKMWDEAFPISFFAQNMFSSTQ
jgi:hypothetical protein